MSLQQFLEANPAAGRRMVGGGKVDIFGQAGNWLRDNVFTTFDPVQEAKRFRARQNAGAPAPRSRAAGLPASARVITQYPDGVSTGMGGGNAGPSQASQWAPAAASPVNRPAPRSAPGMGAPVTYGDSAARTRASAVTTAAQQAGLPPQTAPTLSSQMTSDISSWLSANQGRANASGLEQWMRANANAERSKADRMNIVERFLAKERAAGRMGNPNYFEGFNPEMSSEQSQRNQQVFNMAGKGQLPDVADMSGAGVAPAFNAEMTPEQRQASEQMWQMAARDELPNLARSDYSVRPSADLQGYELAAADPAPQNLLATAGITPADAQQMGATGAEGFAKAMNPAGDFGGVGNFTDPEENRKANLLLNRYTSAITGQWR